MCVFVNLLSIFDVFHCQLYIQVGLDPKSIRLEARQLLLAAIFCSCFFGANTNNNIWLLYRSIENSIYSVQLRMPIIIILILYMHILLGLERLLLKCISLQIKKKHDLKSNQ